MSSGKYEWVGRNSKLYIIEQIAIWWFDGRFSTNCASDS